MRFSLPGDLLYFYSHKLFVCEIIINLALNRVDLARQAFGRSMYDDSYLSTTECAAAEDLLRAFETFDQDKFEDLKTGMTTALLPLLTGL